MSGTPIPELLERVILGADLLEESERYAAGLLALGSEAVHERDIERHRAEGFRSRLPSSHDDVTVTDRTVSIDGRSVPLRQFVPSGEFSGGYLHFHGGGWVFGSASIYDDELAALAHDVGIAVLSVDYRLAPEHPFPAALDDAETAAKWLVRDGAQDLGLERLAIGGWSAGAQLAAIALQRLAESGEASAYRAANLLYGIFDLSMTPSQRLGRATPRVSRADLEWYYTMVMPSSNVEDLRSETISPLYGDLAGMPPARFAVGTLDPLFDDSTFMAERWAAAGAATTLEIYVAGAHGFARQPNGLGVLARRRESEFLASHLSTNVESATSDGD